MDCGYWNSPGPAPARPQEPRARRPRGRPWPPRSMRSRTIRRPAWSATSRSSARRVEAARIPAGLGEDPEQGGTQARAQPSGVEGLDAVIEGVGDHQLPGRGHDRAVRAQELPGIGALLAELAELARPVRGGVVKR